MKVLSLLTHPNVIANLFWKVVFNGHQNGFVTNILQNIFFSVSQKKVIQV